VRERLAGAAGWTLSALFHAAVLGGLALARARAPARPEVVSLEIVETPPPPAPERSEAAAREARSRAPVPRADRAPPPPNQSPSPDAAPPRSAPIRIGVALSATATAGGVAAPVGNTLYGKVPETAPAPEEVKPYRAERTLPPTEVDSPPVPLSLEVPASEYPREAREAGFEGEVRLRLLVDSEGRVREAVVLHDPGKGLGPAAVPIAKRYYRFRPALQGGRPVATEIVLTVRFQLP
jgi:protein TonB